MRRYFAIIASVVCAASSFFAASPAKSQTSNAEVMALLQDKTLFLRGFPAESALQYKADGKLVGSHRVVSYTLAGFKPTKASIEDGRLKLEGKRLGLRFDRTKPEFEPVGGVKLVIPMDSAGGFTEGLSRVFVSGFPALRPELPEVWQWYAKKHFSPTPDETARPKLPVDHSIKPPVPVLTPDPAFTSEARSNNLQGNVMVHLSVESDGSTSGVFLVRPLGLGLDESAVASVKAYRFRPATKDGVPVTFDLYIDVNFQRF